MAADHIEPEGVAEKEFKKAEECFGGRKVWPVEWHGL